jgi:hypothetical protein
MYVKFNQRSLCRFDKIKSVDCLENKTSRVFQLKTVRKFDGKRKVKRNKKFTKIKLNTCTYITLRCPC